MPISCFGPWLKCCKDNLSLAVVDFESGGRSSVWLGFVVWYQAKWLVVVDGRSVPYYFNTSILPCSPSPHPSPNSPTHPTPNPKGGDMVVGDATFGGFRIGLQVIGCPLFFLLTTLYIFLIPRCFLSSLPSFVFEPQTGDFWNPFWTFPRQRHIYLDPQCALLIPLFGFAALQEVQYVGLGCCLWLRFLVLHVVWCCLKRSLFKLYFPEPLVIT